MRLEKHSILPLLPDHLDLCHTVSIRVRPQKGAYILRERKDIQKITVNKISLGSQAKSQ